MSRKVILFFIPIIFFSSCGLVFANVIINEIQVLPTGNKFLELRNTGGSSVDLSGWSIKKKTASGTESTLVVSARLDGKSIAAGGYFLIANETGYTGSGTLDAAWPPSNTGVASNNTIIVYDGNSAEVDKVGWGSAIDCDSPCPANPPDSQSLERMEDGSWIVGTPTPGEENEESETEDEEESEDEDTNEEESVEEEDDSSAGSSSSSSSSSKPLAKPKKTLKPRAEITAKSVAYPGAPISFQGVAFGENGGKLFRGKYFWNFGDGNSREVKAALTDKFSHTYFYSGEYTVLFEHYPDWFAEEPDAYDKMVIKVVEPEISLSTIENQKGFFVELENGNSYDADISSWILTSGGKSFTLPRNTIIGRNKKMILPPKVTNFSSSDKTTLKLLTSNGEPVGAPAPSLAGSAAPRPASSLKTVAPREAEEFLPDEEIIPEYLGASAAESNSAASGNSYLPMVASVIFIGASAGAVYFIRRGGRVSKLGDDFKILDE